MHKQITGFGGDDRREQALRESAAVARREAWLRENAEAIAAYNEFVDENGVFSEGRRSF